MKILRIGRKTEDRRQKTEDRGLRDKMKIMVGGAPVSRNFSDKIGADGYGDNANGAGKLVKALVKS